MAAKDCLHVALLFAPNLRGMSGQRFMTGGAGIERVATPEFDRDNVALGVVMRALGSLVNINAVNLHLSPPRGAENKGATVSEPSLNHS